MSTTGTAAIYSPLKIDPKTIPVYPPDHKPFVTSPDGELVPVLAETGVGAAAPMTVVQVFQKAVARNGGKVALKVERGGANQWVEITWQQYYDDCRRTAKALMALGFQQYQVANILGFQTPEWFYADLGAILAGGMAAGIYTTNTPDACAYITTHSEAPIVFVENEAQLAKYVKEAKNMPKVKAVVVYNGAVPADLAEVPFQVMDWATFIAKGEGVSDDELQARMDAIKPGNCSTLIYTSGTTGPPKAVMISHDNVTWTCASLLEYLAAQHVPLDQEQHIVSFLPLSHIAGQILDMHAPMAITAGGSGCTVYFARPDALKGSLGETLRYARPTIFFGVPRVWEKFAERMKQLGAQSTGLKKSIATWAKGLGMQKFRSSQLGGDKSSPWFYGIAESIVFHKIKAALGLDRCYIQISGAAPISRDTLEYFGQLGIPIMEVYGQSEDTGPHTIGHIDSFRVGTVGFAMNGVETKLEHEPSRDPPGEGEICIRGRHVMMGYMKNDDKTREAIDAEGWLHSGDVGAFDQSGLLSITGRIKELIIGAGGENIAPVPIEDSFKSAAPAVSNVMMVGDRRKYNIILVTLRTEIDLDTGVPSNRLAGDARNVSSATTVGEAQNDKAWADYLNAALKAANAKTVSNAAKIQKWVILPEDFSIPGGELTPTMKTKRKEVEKKYAKLIDELYAEGAEDAAPAKPAASAAGVGNQV